MMDVAGIIKNYIRQEILHNREYALEDTDNLLAAGVIDLADIFRLVSYVEVRFCIEVPNEHVTLGNFQSIKAMTDYLAQHHHVQSWSNGNDGAAFLSTNGRGQQVDRSSI
ncbi:MAG: hypothetical protein ACE5E7_11490 [Anaerolineae bacterium]